MLKIYLDSYCHYFTISLPSLSLSKEAKLTLDEKIQKISDHWFEQAQEDLETAEAIFRQAKRNAAALFFLHLASEK